MKTLPLLIFATSACADDLAPLSDEFNNASTWQNWSDLAEVEGWQAPSYETADINTSEAGRFHIVPASNTWFGHLRGLLFFKEVTGDFVVTTRLRVLSRHNTEDPNEIPNRSFSLTGILVHGPRDITQAAPVPYTTDAVWPPQDFGSDYEANSENYIFLSYGTAGNPGTRQFEIKATRNSNSRLYYDDTGIDQNQTEAWLQMVRVGDTIVCLRKHSEDGEWIVENRYPNPDHPFPDFGPTLQVGLTAYTDWPTAAPFNAAGLEACYHFNYAPPASSTRDLISQVDYFRFARPNPALTEAHLQGMSTSYDPSSNSTANPPILLNASPTAQDYLGETANTPFDFSADNDGDGFPDSLEVALGSDASNASSLPLITCEVVEESFHYSFPTLTSGLELEVQTSHDLVTWHTIASRPGNSILWTTEPSHSVLLNEETQRLSAIIPMDEQVQFVRLAGIF
ncbi:hypothetical protein [Roseibacillus persicicus]|uniref:Uncharacterized protein n=1 Tax=Roseibacillus persicicus TaxID=454148 RepID=A0A918TGJ6_9BACT|nr:hypothetical protein [Roseibacillus persicicus]GHC45811.1 hypothetical protein GCM10007100_09070 [Roseibacillus persicicus]